ncbi:hypothetical protein W97_05249 [Coniosporium apollinis CBS 100218]|uniref:Uncharacterized protein n=1 Tax=Coniosporium apollinis (strain CBS 100218) TaxID=1168221 RepID=R7YWF9_CONA1|nr:uncharacterized protein W97_05249 [Coniosporium apollinis CBS 100218]EON66006.1 hypothetical protein W97_05249 [Coniosporium apollinis CBS 100218]
MSTFICSATSTTTTYTSDRRGSASAPKTTSSTYRQTVHHDPGGTTIETISQKGDEPARQNMKHLDTQGRAVLVAASGNSIIAGHEGSGAGGEKPGTKNTGATTRKRWGSGASGGGEEPRIENVVWRTYEEVVDRERARRVGEGDGRGRFELRWIDCALRNC